MNKQQLLDIHDIIKIHPFRNANDIEYMYDYANMLYDFFKNVYDYATNSDEIDNLSYNAIIEAFHDWSKSTRAMINQGLRFSEKRIDYVNQAIVFSEKALSEIHYFLDNGYFKTISHYISSGSSLAKHFKPQHLIREYRLTNKNKWVLYLLKEEIFYYMEYFNNLKNENDYYVNLYDWYKQLYDEYDENWL